MSFTIPNQVYFSVIINEKLDRMRTLKDVEDKLSVGSMIFVKLLSGIHSILIVLLIHSSVELADETAGRIITEA